MPIPYELPSGPMHITIALFAPSNYYGTEWGSEVARVGWLFLSL